MNKMWLHNEPSFTVESISDRRQVRYCLSTLELNTAAAIQGTKPGEQ